MNQKIFRAIFLSTLLSLILALGAVLFITHEEISSNEIDRLEHVHEILAAGYEDVGLPFLTDAPKTPYRITLIAKDGTVIFDNEASSELDNHLNREEIIEAMQSGHGNSERWSDTLETQTYYWAAQLKDGNILRTAITTDSMLSLTYRMLAYFVVIIIVLCALSMWFASKISTAILMPLYNIDLNHPLSQDCYDEIKPFLTEIDKKQRQIDEHTNMLRNKNEEFLTITKSMSEGLVLLNSEGVILTINKTARKIFGISDDCIGKSFMAIDRGEQAREFFNPQSKVTKRSCEIEKDGRDYHLRFNQIRLDDKVCGYALIIIDVTETKRAEAQRQEFTANVSHELKTPLQAIIGSAELIESGIVKPQDLKLFAGRIREQGTRLISLIEDIIFLSALDEGSGSALFENVSLHKIVSEVFEVLAIKAKKRNVSLKLEGTDLIFPAVYRYIYELIYNLCDNALNYNKESGSVTVRLTELENKYVIEVIDTGIGIAKEHQSRIFERFYRVDKSHSRKTGGTGLGLSIVKRTVLFHHGKIKLKSEVGEGTTFKVTFYKRELVKLSTARDEPAKEGNSVLQSRENKLSFFKEEAKLKDVSNKPAVGSSPVQTKDAAPAAKTKSSRTKRTAKEKPRRITPRRRALQKLNLQ
ncbi:MAG: PAS domain S-box protein [Proteobacteria bacterium]|uniref:histidine kinase n=1 Tax=Candidatus Avisuccinivibrio stercorigallinarum TaxID=2840704 RepID=A0A9D9DDE5_9GAMM|nr:PAS domain S-box protein [Candidatus Avisuccinivibrio stercorigallinarum]